METARPSSCGVSVDQVGDDLTIRRRIGSSSVASFYLVFPAFWTVVCVLLIRRVTQEPTLEHLLLAIPFLAATAFLLAMLPFMLFGFEQLRVGADGLELRTLTGRRLVPLGDVKGIADFYRVVDSESGRIEHGLMVETSGRPIRFGLGLDDDERMGVVGRLLDHLRASLPGRAIEYHPGVDAKPTAFVEVLGPERSIPAPPSDSALRLHAGRDGVEFVRRGSFNFCKLAACTLAVLFCNEIIGAVALAQIKHFPWPDCWIVVPLGAIALVLFYCWLFTLVTPFFVDRWSISPAGVSQRTIFLGMGRARRFEIRDLTRVEVRSDPSSPGVQIDAPYSLSLVGRDGRDLIVAGDLTEGEARWAGGVVCDVLKGWLPEDGGRTPSHRDGPRPMWDREFDG